MWGRRKVKHKVTKESGPQFRTGRMACERDLVAFGPEYVLNFLNVLKTNDPSTWYTLGYQDRTTEGEKS